jgi:hypothetical protein
MNRRDVITLLGGAAGASLFAASVSGRPINGEPGGSGAWLLRGRRRCGHKDCTESAGEP